MEDEPRSERGARDVEPGPSILNHVVQYVDTRITDI
jgi:hypothetical protein